MTSVKTFTHKNVEFDVAVCSAILFCMDDLSFGAEIELWFAILSADNLGCGTGVIGKRKTTSKKYAMPHKTSFV